MTETEMAERDAKRRDPRWDADPPINRNLYYEGHRDGWNAALGFLDSDEAEEKIARAIAESDGETWDGPHTTLENDERGFYRNNARSVLAVIRGETG